VGQDVTQGQVQLRLRFREGRDLPAGEDLWAEPVNTYDGGGVYRLASTSSVVPLGYDDIVCAAVDGGGRLQVVDVIETSDRVLTVCGHDDTVTAEEARQVAASWASGAQGSTQVVDGMVYTAWPEGMTLDRIAAALQRTIGDQPQWQCHAAALPGDRVRDMQDDVDFHLDTEAAVGCEAADWELAEIAV
jgi:hypothetical protein